VFDELEKTRRNLADRYPQKQPDDRAYDATRLVLSLFPNGAGTEILSLILAAPVVLRRDEWMRICNLTNHGIGFLGFILTPEEIA
jgi:hypothetical protein